MNLFGLTYVSSASGLYSPDVYREIARASQAFNGAQNITGLLLVYNETVMQFLEGSEFAVKALYAKIEIDPRHKNPMVVSTRSLPQREFQNWSMGFEDHSNNDNPGFLFNVEKIIKNQFIPANISTISHALIHSFKRSSGLVNF